MYQHSSKSKRLPEAQAAAQQRRQIRYTTREKMRDITSNKRVRTCGTPMGDVGLKLSVFPDGSKVAGFSGLETCGFQGCPVCASKIANHRQKEIEHVVKSHLAAGGSVVMLTLTMRHHKGQGLAELWDALSAAWKAATNGSGWKADREKHGVQHYVRVVEVTHGANGWHVHVHALLLGDDRLKNPLTRLNLAERMFSRWQEKLVNLGMKAPIFSKGGADIQYISPTAEVAKVIAEYVSKSGAGSEITAPLQERVQAAKHLKKAHSLSLEVARGDVKEARKGNRTPWKILRDFLETGDLDDLDIWREFERGLRGRRTITWSRGVRDAYEMEEELSDEEIAEMEHDGQVMAVLDDQAYRKGCRISENFPAAVLTLLENEGVAGVDKLLYDLGLPLTRPYIPPGGLPALAAA